MNPIIPRFSVNIRPATLADLPFIDALQKRHSHMVGWMQTKALEGKIEKGEAIVAEDGGRAIGYCIGSDRYFKHDDVGIIYQMNVEPGRQRGLVGACLLKAQFERSAWGCKLYCCWCAQDLEANRFWEAMGLVPLAFRAGGKGSRGKRRVHIFWQRRIRAGDVTTPYWFPSQTGAGAIKEDRLVLPIPPGTHWRDVMPIVLPGERSEVGGQRSGKTKALAAPKVQPPTQQRVQFGRPGAVVQPEEPVKKEKAKRAKAKNDPRLVSAARELRDRWLEQVNAAGGVPVSGEGKYDVSRVMAGSIAVRQLAA